MANLSLAYRGTMLQDDDDLSTHNIQSGDTIEVWLRGDCCETPRLSEELPRGLEVAMRATSLVVAVAQANKIAAAAVCSFSLDNGSHTTVHEIAIYSQWRVWLLLMLRPRGLAIFSGQ
jgi:hypothetical protein